MFQIIRLHASPGRKIWQAYVNRQTQHANPLSVRNDVLTLKAFGRPICAREAVRQIVAEVAAQGDKAVLKYLALLDNLRTTAAGLRVPGVEQSRARNQISKNLRQALTKAAEHITAFHRQQLPRPFRAINRKGVRISEHCLPLKRVGIYVPGGTAPLVSTVLMNALPARVAGVREIVMATPPGKDGFLMPALLYAAELAGIQAIYRVGGAAGIAALALGTETIARVDKIVGPGNIFVTEAKRQLVGQVGIDSLAGPSEILIIADDSANPRHLLWDLLAQGEHGSGAIAILLSPSQRLLAAVLEAVKNLAEKNPEWQPALKALGLFQVKSLEQAIALANDYAPEHLALQVKKSRLWMKKIQTAGALFLGTTTAQAMGDYIAGTNHVLPTGGTARFSSSLSVRDFLRYASRVEYTAVGMKKEGPLAITLAEAEGLQGHAESIRQRVNAF